jgi:hypothetical protein
MVQQISWDRTVASHGGGQEFAHFEVEVSGYQRNGLTGKILILLTITFLPVTLLMFTGSKE